MTMIAPTAPGARAAGERTTSLADSFDGFLKLLTSQLEHQDPLSPLDATKFTSQLVEFASVEQAIRTNARLDQLVAHSMHGARNAALGYLGNVVEIDTGLAELTGEGGAEFAFQLPAAAASVSVRVVDSSGRTVRELPAGRQAGTNSLRWDGTSDTGQRQRPGLYRIVVDARDARGSAITVSTRDSGEVTGISGLPDQIRLDIGERRVPVDAVLGVRRPAAA